ncbi:MAG: hypothetical protein OEZ01_11565, partial [Candidatus Heimdallarchaeota archaeon]|nr:hypothetical protein [Candidatus Heimdallarchaeota archaeon]
MDIHELENPKLLTYQQIGLRIQLSAATLATSFLLIEIPNVETITLMCFLLGFLFKPRFAYSTVLTIVISWEVLATIIFAFSGITFPFKLFAWLIVCSLGIFARKIHVKSPIIFALFGFISALIYDILVTIPVAMLFLGNNTGFVTIYVSSFVFGLYFTLSHTLSNTLFFFFIPLLINNILLLLNLYFSSIVMIDDEYLNIDITTKETELIDGLNKLYSKRIIIYFLTL